MSAPDVSVVVVSWNTRVLTTACLASLPAAASRCTWESWVVDNASSDDSVAAIAAAHPTTNVLVNDRNLGFAAANNLGVARAAGRYVLLLNSDTVMPPGCLDVLVDFADAHPRAGVVGAMLLNPDGTYQGGPMPFPSLWNEWLAVTGLGRRCTFGGYPSKPEHQAREAQRADYVGGACMFARRKAIDEVGGLDEGYFMYAEEPDWCWRMQRAGWEVWYTPDARVTHYGGQSTSQVREAMKVALYRSKVRFFRQHRSRWSALCAAALFVVASHARRVVRWALRITPVGAALGARAIWSPPAGRHPS